MIRRALVTALPLLTVALAVGAIPAPSVADAPTEGNQPVVTHRAGVAFTPAGPSVRKPTPLDQPAIYQILCGGSMTGDGALSRHLWAVAGSLANGHWTPPRVTIRVIVSPPSHGSIRRPNDG